MKKRIILLLICILTLTVCLFTACKKDEVPDGNGATNGGVTNGGTIQGGGNSPGGSTSTHEHDFSAKTPTPAYLKSSATETSDAVFYYKCSSCSEKGTETYNYHSDGLKFTARSDTACGVTGIGTCADKYVVIPYMHDGKKVTTINNNAFYSDTFTTVIIPDSVETIDYNAFYNCSSLASVAVGSGVTNIGSQAFDCKNLKKVYISDVASWCAINFTGGYSSNPLYYAKNLYLNNDLLTELVIPDTLTTINDYAFYNCEGLTSVTISANITNIGSNAFWGCDNISSVHISDISKWCAISFETFSSNPLYNNANIILNGSLVTDLVIPDKVTNIGDYAFCSCDGLNSVTISESVTSIGTNAFSYCSNLSTVTIGKNLESIGDAAFAECKGLFKINFNATNVEDFKYNHTVFSNLGENTDGITVTFSNNVKKIPSRLFYNISKIKTVVISDNVTSIGSLAFSGCEMLTSIKYIGTEIQWNTILKPDGWDSYTGNYTVTYNYTGE